MPWLRGEAHHCNYDGHAESRAQQHDFTSVFISELAPYGLKNKSRRKVGGKYRSGPQADSLFTLHMQISRQVER
ncbi:hypothetical protein D3C77_444010 [compost metagenome]